jgi:hypothetical protein
MLAQTLGGQISACDPPGAGWQVIESSDPPAVPSGPWMVWYEEKFSVPVGGQEIARTSVCPQAFVCGPHMGLQFHPGVTADLLMSWVSEADGRGALADTERRALLTGRDGIPDAVSPQRSAHLFTTFASRAGLTGPGPGPAGAAGYCHKPGSLVC